MIWKLLAGFLMLTLAALAVSRSGQASVARRVVNANAQSLDADQAPPELEPTALELLVEGGGTLETSDFLRAAQKDEVFSAEPARLRPLPEGRREGGMRRLRGGVAEEVVQWSVPQSLEAVRAHYEPQIRSLNLRPLTAQSGAGGDERVLSQVWVSKKEDPLDRVLILRISPEDDGTGVRVVLWFRYAIEADRP